MKKILATLTALLIVPTSVNAAVYTFDNKISDTFGVLAAYDSLGTLTAVKFANLSPKDGKLVTDDIAITADKVKFFSPSEKITLKGTLLQTEAPVPPINTDLYPNDFFALHAPALIKDIHTEYVDGEDVFTLTLLYKGEELDFTAKSDFLIETASAANQAGIGQNASYLQKGDVIILNYAFKNEPKSICLLYRPSETEPLLNDELSDYSSLYTNGDAWSTDLKDELSHQYGVVTDITKNAIAICDKDGKAEYIPFKSNAAVYVYNSENKKYTDIIGVDEIDESYIDEGAADDADNIIDWTKTSDRVYALIRAIDGMATDIVIYKY